MRKTSVKLIKLTTRHTFAAFLWSLLCSHQFGSQGKVYVSQTPPCTTTQNLPRKAFSPFSTRNHGCIYWKLCFKCKVLVNHQVIPQKREQLHYKVHFQMWWVCSKPQGALLWEGTPRLLRTPGTNTSSTQQSCLDTELPCVTLLPPKGSNPSLLSKSKRLFTLPFEASVPNVLP